MNAHFRSGVGHRKACNGGVFFQAAPVALVGESLTARDPQGGKYAPSADQPYLSGRKPDFLDRQQRVIVKRRSGESLKPHEKCKNLSSSIVSENRKWRGIGEKSAP